MINIRQVLITNTNVLLFLYHYLRGMLPLGNSAWVSCILTFWKSTNLDLLTSSMNLLLLLQTGFRHIVGWKEDGISIETNDKYIFLSQNKDSTGACNGFAQSAVIFISGFKQ